MWEKKIYTISETMGKHPQESYSAVVHVIQSEWIFIHRVTNNTGDIFAVVEKMLREMFCLTFSLEFQKLSHPL